MPHYCSLIIRSDRENEPDGLLLPQAIEALDFTDNFSPERLASAERMRAAGFVRRADLPRFVWILESRDDDESAIFDLDEHVTRLLSQFKSIEVLDRARNRGVEAFLSLYYGGNGTGGGPFISPSLSEHLARYKMPLQVGFYYEDAEQ